MIDPATESLISIKQARDEFPNRPSVPTLWRWVLKGVGQTRLDSIMVGGRRFTSKEACRRFIADRSGDSNPPKPNKREQQQSFIAAKAILDHFNV